MITDLIPVGYASDKLDWVWDRPAAIRLSDRVRRGMEDKGGIEEAEGARLERVMTRECSDMHWDAGSDWGIIA